MNDNAVPLVEDVQTKDVFNETFTMSNIQTVLLSIAENISTSNDSPKDTLPNNKINSKKVKLR